jgi:hypothetical protein
MWFGKNPSVVTMMRVSQWNLKMMERIEPDGMGKERIAGPARYRRDFLFARIEIQRKGRPAQHTQVEEGAGMSTSDPTRSDPIL